jgi:hypothetical protein
MKKEFAIGDKVISLERANALVDKIFDLRSSGSTQAEVAQMLGVERSFISHLEGIGEVRRSKEIAFIGSGVGDAEHVDNMARELGFEHVFINDDGLARIEDALGVLAILKDIDFIVFLGPLSEHKLLETVLDKKVIGVSLDKESDLERVLAEFAGKRTRRAFRSVRRGEKKGDAKRSGQRKHWLVEPGPRG